jgi:hypothetical protein
MQSRSAVTWCSHVVLSRGAIVPSRGAVTWCSHMVQSHGAVTWCSHVVQSRGAVTWCSHVVQPRGAATWCSHVVPSRGAVACRLERQASPVPRTCTQERRRNFSATRQHPLSVHSYTEPVEGHINTCQLSHHIQAYKHAKTCLYACTSMHAYTSKHTSMPAYTSKQTGMQAYTSKHTSIYKHILLACLYKHILLVCLYKQASRYKQADTSIQACTCHIQACQLVRTCACTYKHQDAVRAAYREGRTEYTPTLYKEPVQGYTTLYAYSVEGTKDIHKDMRLLCRGNLYKGTQIHTSSRASHTARSLPRGPHRIYAYSEGQGHTPIEDTPTLHHATCIHLARSLPRRPSAAAGPATSS